jgi:hypothetical protein
MVAVAQAVDRPFTEKRLQVIAEICVVIGVEL